MTERQTIALEHPCYRGYETAHDRYAAVLRARHRWFSSLLTVNK